MLDARSELRTRFLITVVDNKLVIQRLNVNFYWLILILYSVFVFIVDSAVLIQAIHQRNLLMFLAGSIFFVAGGLVGFRLYMFERKKLRSLLQIEQS